MMLGVNRIPVPIVVPRSILYYSNMDIKTWPESRKNTSCEAPCEATCTEKLSVWRAFLSANRYSLGYWSFGFIFYFTNFSLFSVQFYISFKLFIALALTSYDGCINEKTPLPLHTTITVNWPIQEGGRGGARDAHPPLSVHFFIFMQLLGKIGQNNSLVPPPFANPESATAIPYFALFKCLLSFSPVVYLLIQSFVHIKRKQALFSAELTHLSFSE